MKCHWLSMIDDLERFEKGKRLFLHSCCAPCSSYVLEYLREQFAITVFFYNPNITERKEYELRCDEQKRLLALTASLPSFCPPGFIEGAYDTGRFYEIAKGFELNAEGGERCSRCVTLRLQETARVAGELGFDYFATTLTVRPLKKAEKINEIGLRIAKEMGGPVYLASDFKKKGGAGRSLALSKTYSLYRQKFCGCAFSRRDTPN